MTTRMFDIGNVKIVITLPAFEEAVLADQVVDPGDWLNGFANMVFSKLENVKERIIAAEVKQALAEGKADQLPATKDALVQAKFDRSGYQTRAQRDASQ